MIIEYWQFHMAQFDGEGQGNLACCSSRSCKESDTTWRLNSNNSTILTLSMLEVEIRLSGQYRVLQLDTHL